MTYGLHVTDDVTWPWKVKLVTPIHLAQYLKTAVIRDSVPKDHLSEIAYVLSNGHVTAGVTWPPTVMWGSTVGYPSDSLASCCFRIDFSFLSGFIVVSERSSEIV